MTVYLHEGDLPGDVFAPGPIAVDSETMGLNPHRDRLCVVQLSDGQGDEHLVRFAPGQYDAPILKRILADPARLKLYHFARFDLAGPADPHLHGPTRPEGRRQGHGRLRHLETAAVV